MFEKITPEEAGVKSENVLRFLKFLNRNGLVMHDVLLAKGEKIFGEYYWKPFHQEFCHRMYSETKSFVGIAIGLLQDEGKLNINDRIIDYFPEKLDTPPTEDLKKQTIRDMLIMETAVVAPYWFDSPDEDRTHEYLNSSKTVRRSGTIYEYDSAGSQVLASLVEKLSGMSLYDYLNKKIFSKLGTFKTAEILKTRNNDSWGDSALVARPRDMFSFAKLLVDGGVWKGEQLISKEYVKDATSALVVPDRLGFETDQTVGYGYQIWIHSMNGFFFNGMGMQFTIAIPEKDLIVVCNADNQGFAAAKDLFFSSLREFIVDEMETGPIPENKKAEKELEEYGNSLELYHLNGKSDSTFKEKLNYTTYILQENKMGIEKFRFDFEDEGGTFVYTNKQGEKKLPFKFNANAFCKFPQLGYSNEHGGLRTTDGFMYDCAVSACFAEEKKIFMKVQVIDKYFGNIFATFGFRDDEVTLVMVKTAEDFFREYEGSARGKKA